MRAWGGGDVTNVELNKKLELLDDMPEFKSNLGDRASFSGWTEADWDAFIGGVYIWAPNPLRMRAPGEVDEVPPARRGKIVYGRERLAKVGRDKLQALGVKSAIVQDSTGMVSSFWLVLFDPDELEACQIGVEP